MVGIDLDWPKNLVDYFKTENSPLNPHNQGYGFFVYGPLPLFLTKAVAGIFNLDNYNSFNLVGRLLSALFDLGVVFLLFKISKNFWSSLFYSLMVLPAQLSHFFAVDAFLNFFLVLSFYSALNWPVFLSGVFLGLALACKISAFLFIPVIGLAIFSKLKLDFKKSFFSMAVFLLAAFISFRVFSPYSFSGLFRINSQFLENIKALNSYNDPEAWFPPAVQWIKARAIIFPGINLFFWGLGIPLGILVILALVKKGASFLFQKKRGFDYLTISLFWVLAFFIFQGIQFVKTMRYFLLIYPFLALIAGDFFSKLKIKKKKMVLVLFPLFLYPLAFISIYSRPHTRVEASEWILKNIPPEAVLSCEYWDDCLPLGYHNYQIETLHFYDPESEEKWQKLGQQLEKIDYLILSSNRLWGSIPKVPEKYPLTSEFYQKLFNQELEFEKVIQFSSYPRLLGINLVDDWAEEAFSVYDHPKVIIFKKTNY